MREKNNMFTRIWDRPYGRINQFHLFDAAKNSKQFVQKLRLERKIPVHLGCVNSICWNDSGKYLLSGSDDQRLSIVHGYDYSVLAFIQTGHRANIFSAKFLPNTGDSHVISCSGDGIIIYSDVEWAETSMNNKFNCHVGTTYEIMTVPNDPNTFLSCGEDRTVRWFDLRTKNSCSKADCKEDVLINCRSPVTSLAVNPMTPYQLAVGCADSSVRLFDRRMLGTRATGNYSSNGSQALMTCFTVPEFTQNRRITSLCYSSDGQEMLVSYSSDYIYLFDIRDNLEKTPRLLSHDLSLYGSDEDASTSRSRPLMKRLRVRGDWSDTGPQARPEAESRGEQQATSSQANILRRMTDILTRMLNTTSHSTASQSSSASSRISSEGEMDVPSDSNDDERDENAAEEETSPGVAPKLEESQNTEAGPSNELSKNPLARKPLKQEDSKSTPNKCTDGEPTDPCVRETNASQASTSRTSISIAEEIAMLDTSPVEALNLSIQTINQLSSRRKDLLEKHCSEPMVNLHYSGQSVSSGLITMDVASSSTANEQQWLEQSGVAYTESPSPDSVPMNNPSVEVPVNSYNESCDTEIDAEIASIEVNHSLPLVVDSDPAPHLNAPQESGETTEGEVALMMEVDSWDVDSDEDGSSQSPETNRAALRARSECRRLSDNFFCSLDDGLKKEESQLMDVTEPRVKQKFTGHRNARTMIKESTFWGDNFIMSGSDCGHIFVWDRFTAELVMLMEADHHVVNCLQPHPYDPILASSGIDYDIKLWVPSREEPFFDLDKANEMIKRNEIMLEETKDTITVPASFMVRMLATLNHFRSGTAHNWSRAARQLRNASTDAGNR